MFTPDRLADARKWVDGSGERLSRLLSTKWFPLAVNLLVLVVVVASLARWTWRVLLPISPAPVPVSAVGTAPVRFDVQTALSAQLFGAAPMQAGAVEDIPVSSLNLVLTGIIAGAKDSGYALIRVDGQPEAPFAVGDDIVSGAVLQQVYADRVIIRRGGRMESLMLEGPAPLPAVSQPPSAPLAATQSRPPAASPSLGAIRQDARNAYTLPRALVNEELRNPQQLLSQSLMVPNAGGGFLVREIQPGSVYQKLGLRVGDVIRSANGQPVNTLEDAVKAYQQAANNNYIRLEIVRAGKPETLQYTLQ